MTFKWEIKKKYMVYITINLTLNKDTFKTKRIVCE